MVKNYFFCIQNLAFLNTLIYLIKGIEIVFIHFINEKPIGTAK